MKRLSILLAVVVLAGCETGTVTQWPTLACNGQPFICGTKSSYTTTDMRNMLVGNSLVIIAMDSPGEAYTLKEYANAHLGVSQFKSDGIMLNTYTDAPGQVYRNRYSIGRGDGGKGYVFESGMSAGDGFTPFNYTLTSPNPDTDPNMFLLKNSNGGSVWVYIIQGLRTEQQARLMLGMEPKGRADWRDKPAMGLRGLLN